VSGQICPGASCIKQLDESRSLIGPEVGEREMAGDDYVLFRGYLPDGLLKKLELVIAKTRSLAGVICGEEPPSCRSALTYGCIDENQAMGRRYVEALNYITTI
jgi:hypothetical protein